MTFYCTFNNKKCNFIKTVENVGTTLPKFLINQNFGGALAAPAPPALHHWYIRLLLWSTAKIEIGHVL